MTWAFFFHSRISKYFFVSDYLLNISRNDSLIWLKIFISMKFWHAAAASSRLRKFQYQGQETEVTVLLPTYHTHVGCNITVHMTCSSWDKKKLLSGQNVLKEVFFCLQNEVPHTVGLYGRHRLSGGRREKRKGKRDRNRYWYRFGNHIFMVSTHWFIFYFFFDPLLEQPTCKFIISLFR